MFRPMKSVLILVFALTLPAGVVHAKVSFESILSVDMDAPILDIATDPDQDLIFLLTPAAVLFYSPKEKAVIDRIALSEPFDRQCTSLLKLPGPGCLWLLLFILGTPHLLAGFVSQRDGLGLWFFNWHRQQSQTLFQSNNLPNKGGQVLPQISESQPVNLW